MPGSPLYSIGLYHENAIAIQKESGDSNGGKVQYGITHYPH